MAALLALIAQSPSVPANPDTATPGAIGFVILLVMAGAVYLLFRSMRKQLARVDVPHAQDVANTSEEDGDPDDGAPA